MAELLKDSLFGAERIRHIAAELKAVCPAFDARGFVSRSLATLDTLTLMQRLRHVTEQLHAALPLDFVPALEVLRQLAPRLDNSFVAMVLSDYVALYGAEDFEASFEVSLEALRFFTAFGSAEFAIRHFLSRDLSRTLKVMEGWARDDDAHVRRLASEGCRPRLPWAVRIEPLVADPGLCAPILERLKADPSPYVRKSVANHLNDHTKAHPEWVLARLRTWPLDVPETAWIARHALRVLVKQGHREALALLGAGEDAQVRLHELAVSPETVRLGGQVTLSFRLESLGDAPQKLVVDYAVLYPRATGRTSRKVFKLKTVVLQPGAEVALSRRQTIRDFSTRTHHPGRHDIEVLANGRVLGRTAFVLGPA